MHIGKKDGDEKRDKRKVLEEEVDAMMDPKRPDGPAHDGKAPDEPAPQPARPKVSAVSAPAAPAKTAPELSDDLRKKIGISDAGTKPLSIEKLDEITVRIAGSGKDDKPGKADNEDKPGNKDDDGEETAEDDKPAGRKSEDRPAPQKDLDEGSTDLDDARTEEAVDDIVSHEGDVMLAVEDATRKERNPDLKAAKTDQKEGGHRVLSTILWTLVVFVAIIAVLFLVLLVTGQDVTAK